MQPEKRYKIVLYTLPTHTDALLDAIGEAGAGVIGNYTYCSFTLRGTGRFKPGPGSNPTIGEEGIVAEVEEDRIETVCSANKLAEILSAIKRVHPYEEPATDVYPIEVFE